MHYYQFNIGDYASHTRYLTPIQDLAYRRLIDLYYLQEKPIQPENPAAIIGLSEHRTDVEHVLNTYFVLSEHGWLNKRVEQEIAEYKGKRKVKVYAGKKSGEARRAKKIKDNEQTLNMCSTDVKQNTDFVELTNNHKPITNKKNTQTKLVSARFEEFWNAFDDKRGRGGAEKAWNKINPDDELADKIISGAKRYIKVRGSDRKFWKQAQGWLNDKRWEDDAGEQRKFDYDDLSTWTAEDYRRFA